MCQYAEFQNGDEGLQALSKDVAEKKKKNHLQPGMLGSKIITSTLIIIVSQISEVHINVHARQRQNGRKRFIPSQLDLAPSLPASEDESDVLTSFLAFNCLLSVWTKLHLPTRVIHVICESDHKTHLLVSQRWVLASRRLCQLWLSWSCFFNSQNKAFQN